MADYDEAIQLDPNYAQAYYARGVARNSLRDYQGAVADYDQAIRLKSELYPGLLQPWDCAAGPGRQPGGAGGLWPGHPARPKLYPGLRQPWGCALRSAGLSGSGGGPHSGHPARDTDYALPYYNRGRLRSALGNPEGARSDFQRASDLYQAQGDSAGYQRAQDQIAQLPTRAATIDAPAPLAPAGPTAATVAGRPTVVPRPDLTLVSRDFPGYEDAPTDDVTIGGTPVEVRRLRRSGSLSGPSSSGA